jgi:hypothetical protein
VTIEACAAVFEGICMAFLWLASCRCPDESPAHAACVSHLSPVTSHPCLDPLSSLLLAPRARLHHSCAGAAAAEAVQDGCRWVDGAHVDTRMLVRERRQGMQRDQQQAVCMWEPGLSGALIDTAACMGPLHLFCCCALHISIQCPP